MDADLLATFGIVLACSMTSYNSQLSKESCDVTPDIVKFTNFTSQKSKKNTIFSISFRGCLLVLTDKTKSDYSNDFISSYYHC